MIVDVHNHYYPPEFIAAVRKGPSRYAVEEDAEGNPVLVSPGDRNFVVPGHRDIGFRERVIAEAGVDVQAITLTAPSRRGTGRSTDWAFGGAGFNRGLRRLPVSILRPCARPHEEHARGLSA
jgi:hypothetical protein